MIKNKNIHTLPKLSCTGCGLCNDLCPKECISFVTDSEFFLYPQVDEQSCINCGQCVQKCPAFNVKLNEKPKTVFSAYASEMSIRNNGSSGGIFSLIATEILSKSGIVYGAAFDDQLKLQHRRVDNIEDIRPLCKSKYIQSNCTEIYSKVKKDLESGKQVVFVGTPCQCQALSNYIGTLVAENLLLIDFVCHGVPNQKLFDDNLKWNASKYGKVKSIEFRYKDKKVIHPQTLKMVYEKNGKDNTMIRMHYQDPYYFGFQKHITLRPSCYQCQWAKPKRCSDITLADFWGIEKANIGLDGKNGISCLLLNTEKGKDVFDRIKNKIDGVYELPIDFAVRNNGCLSGPTEKPKYRDQFFIDWNNEGYENVVNKYLVSKRKWIFDIYYAIPSPIRKIVRKLMENRMKYE